MNSVVASTVLILLVGSFRGLDANLVYKMHVKNCYSSEAVCVPVAFCSNMEERIECRDCSTKSVQRVYCEPKAISVLGKNCTTVRGHRGKCVAKEQCDPRARFRKGEFKLQQDMCYQAYGKDYYCCPERKIIPLPESQMPNVASIKNAYSTCSDPKSRKPGVSIPVVQCNHLKGKMNRNTVGLVLGGKCHKSNLRLGSSMCCTENPNITSAWIPHEKAQKLGLNKCGPMHLKNNIIGGSEVESGAYPWMASLMYQGRNGRLETRCGGTLIHPRYVLTAAHCLQTGLVKVRFDHCGTPVNKACKQREYKIKQQIPHKSYEFGVTHNDIALLKVSSNIPLDPICLPLREHLLMLLPWTLTVVGRGMTEKRIMSNVLLEADADASYCPRDRCLGEDTICVRGKRDNSGAHCSGDSGGPYQQLVAVDHDTFQVVQFGVVAAGTRGCMDEGIATSVAYHIQWILNHMEI